MPWQGLSAINGSGQNTELVSLSTGLRPVDPVVTPQYPPVRKIHPLKEKRPKDPKGDVAYLRWGRGSSFGSEMYQEDLTFTRDDLDPDTDGEQPNNGYTPPEDEDDEGSQPEHIFEEESRKTEKIRVENPDNPRQYVVVERVTSITFKGPKWSQRAEKVEKLSIWDFNYEERKREQEKKETDKYTFVFKPSNSAS